MKCRFNIPRFPSQEARSSPGRKSERGIGTVRLGRARRGPREDFLGGLERQDVNTCVLSRERRCQAGRTEVTRCNLRQPTSTHQASGPGPCPSRFPSPPRLPANALVHWTEPEDLSLIHDRTCHDKRAKRSGVSSVPR